MGEIRDDQTSVRPGGAAATMPSLSRRAGLMRPSALREMLSGGAQPRLSLAGGLPPAEAFPFDTLASVAANLFANGDVGALQYAPAEGDRCLRDQVADMLTTRHRLPIRASQVIITSGSQQGIDLVGRVLLDPGDVAVVESPTYVGALRSLVPLESRVVGIRCDDGGLDTALLEQRLQDGLRPALCYVVANFSNPSGATLTAERRQHLAALAAHYGFVVVEDDQYGRLRFRGSGVDPIATETDHVVYLGGFSKVVAPGLRVGFLVAPEWLVRPLVLAKQAADLAASSLGQRIVSGLLDLPGWLDGHVDVVSRIYAARADALVEAVERRLGGTMQIRRPDGGMFTWATLRPESLTADELVTGCHRRGLALVAGHEFSVDGGFDRELRLSYSMLTPAEIDEAVTVMSQAIDDVARTGR